MKDFIRITLASPQRILSWTERPLPNGTLVGEIFKSVRNSLVFKIRLRFVKKRLVKVQFNTCTFLYVCNYLEMIVDPICFI